MADEQFGMFVEVIRKLYVNIPLLDAMQVPTYAKYITEVVQLTKECSAAILDPLLEKKKDPGLLTELKCHFHPSTILNNKGKLHALLTYLYH